jgi:hypothetical protein
MTTRRARARQREQRQQTPFADDNKKAKAKITAEPFGMTTKKTKARHR